MKCSQRKILEFLVFKSLVSWFCFYIVSTYFMDIIDRTKQVVFVSVLQLPDRELSLLTLFFFMEILMTGFWDYWEWTTLTRMLLSLENLSKIVLNISLFRSLLLLLRIRVYWRGAWRWRDGFNLNLRALPQDQDQDLNQDQDQS